MPISRSSFQDRLHRWPLQHPLAPGLYVGPVVDVHSEEAKHPRHREGEVRDIRERWPVLKRNVVLPRLAQTLVEDVPLANRILMEPRFLRPAYKGVLNWG